MTISISKGLGKRFQHSSVLVALLLLTMLVVPIPVWAVVSVDTKGFSADLTTTCTNYDYYLENITTQPDGKILVGGTLGRRTELCPSKIYITRLNNDGSRDVSLDISAFVELYTESFFSTFALQADGKILVGGSNFNDSGTALTIFARLTSDGSLDTTFEPNITGGDIGSVIQQSDGKIIVSGNFTEVDEAVRDGLARLNLDGSLDTSFDPAVSASVSALQSDGKILLSNLVRLNPDGSLDTSFLPNIDGSAYLRALLPDGKILTSGSFTAVDGIPRDGFSRLNTDGSLDIHYVPEYRVAGTQRVASILIQQDGKVIRFGHPVDGRFVAPQIDRLNPDGTEDTGFVGPDLFELVGATQGSGDEISLRDATLQNDGKVLLTGSISVGAAPDPGFTSRLNVDGSPDSGYTDSTVSDWIQAVAIQPDGKGLIGGFFTDIDGVSRNHIARLNIDRSVDTSFDPGTGANDWISTLVLQPDGKVLIGGEFTQVDGEARIGIARLNDDGSLDSSFVPGSGATTNVRSMALQSDGKVLLGGGFGMTRYNPNGSLDASFNSDPNSTVYAIAQQSDGKILISGRFTEVNGVTRIRTARLNANGSLDTSFDPGVGANGTIYAMALQSDGKVLIGGDYTLVDGIDRKHIARLNADGSLDTSFDLGIGVDGIVLSLAVQGDGKILLGGYFTSIDGVSHNRIARLHPDGSLDADFDLGTGANGSVETIALQGDGSVVIGGHFTEVDGIEQNYISRLIQDEAALQQLSAAVDGESVTWLRDGVGPVLERVTFEFSDSLYGGWTLLGSGQRTAGGWTLDGLNFPVGQNIYIRARGYYGTGAGSMTETILQFYLEKPSIQVSNTANPSVLKEPGGTVTFNITVNNTSGTNTVTINTLTDIFYGNLNGEGNCSVPRTITAGSRYNCAFDADITGSAGVSETDTVTASGADEYGNPMSHSDSATVKIIKDGGCVYYTPKNKSPMMICW